MTSYNHMKYLALLLLLLMKWGHAFSSHSQKMFSKHFPPERASIPEHKLLLTYLEINGFLLTTAGITLLIDPVLEGPLDFGIPQIYTGEKKILSMSGLIQKLPPIDAILITQGLDDHAHVRTLTGLARESRFNDVPIIAPPSAKGALETSGMVKGRNVQFLKHGWGTKIMSTTESSVQKPTEIAVRATSGALVGPPWQTRENGYILRPSSASGAIRPPSIYIEPHAEFKKAELQKESPIDVVITPIVGQCLPVLDLVYGPESAASLIKELRPKIVVPMMNANVKQSGILSPLVSQNGSKSDFVSALNRITAERRPKVLEIVPGQDTFVEV